MPQFENLLIPPTGFHASTAEQYAEAFAKALTLSDSETLEMRLRARKSAGRFTEEVFARKWIMHMEQLVLLQQKLNPQRDK